MLTSLSYSCGKNVKFCKYTNIYLSVTFLLLINNNFNPHESSSSRTIIILKCLSSVEMLPNLVSNAFRKSLFSLNTFIIKLAGMFCLCQC